MTTSAAPVDMLELLRSAIVVAKKTAALTRTTQAPVKLTVQRFAGAPSLAGAAAIFCLPVATCCLIFCLVLACFTAFCSAFFVSSFASVFASAATFSFAALIVNSFAVSSASKDWWRKFFGMRIVMPKPSA